jgi:hypothetical protein
MLVQPRQGQHNDSPGRQPRGSRESYNSALQGRHKTVDPSTSQRFHCVAPSGLEEMGSALPGLARLRRSAAGAIHMPPLRGSGGNKSI